MFAIIGSIPLFVLIVLSVFLICGAPLGELTMGGQYKVFPQKLRIVLFLQVLLQILFVCVLWQLGGFLPLCVSPKAAKITGIVMAVYLSLNCFMNAFSKSKKERFIMTPLSLIVAISFWFAVFQF